MKRRAKKKRASSPATVRRHLKKAGVALLDGSLGTVLVHSAAALKHASRRKNPPLPVRRFTSAKGHLVSRAVLSLDYYNAGSAQRRPYTHEFTPRVELWALPDGSLLLRGPGGRRIWDDFYVKDSE